MMHAGFWTGMVTALALVTGVLYWEKKDRDALIATLVCLVLIPASMLTGLWVSAVVWACVAVLGVRVYRLRRKRHS